MTAAPVAIATITASAACFITRRPAVADVGAEEGCSRFACTVILPFHSRVRGLSSPWRHQTSWLHAAPLAAGHRNEPRRRREIANGSDRRRTANAIIGHVPGRRIGSHDRQLAHAGRLCWSSRRCSPRGRPRTTGYPLYRTPYFLHSQRQESTERVEPDSRTADRATTRRLATAAASTILATDRAGLGSSRLVSTG